MLRILPENPPGAGFCFTGARCGFQTYGKTESAMNTCAREPLLQGRHSGNAHPIAGRFAKYAIDMKVALVLPPKDASDINTIINAGRAAGQRPSGKNRRQSMLN